MLRYCWTVLLAFALLLLDSEALPAKTEMKVRPYEFGFTIAEQQHRVEKKDERGIVMGEFGFITADGIYHVTVYATDEEGKFRILAMRNYPYESPPKTIDMVLKPKVKPVTTTAAPIVVEKKAPARHNFYTEACSGCFIKNAAPNPTLTETKKPAAKSGIRPLSQPLAPEQEAEIRMKLAGTVIKVPNQIVTSRPNTPHQNNDVIYTTSSIKPYTTPYKDFISQTEYKPNTNSITPNTTPSKKAPSLNATTFKPTSNSIKPYTTPSRAQTTYQPSTNSITSYATPSKKDFINTTTFQATPSSTIPSSNTFTSQTTFQPSTYSESSEISNSTPPKKAVINTTTFKPPTPSSIKPYTTPSRASTTQTSYQPSTNTITSYSTPSKKDFINTTTFQATSSSTKPYTTPSNTFTSQTTFQPSTYSKTSNYTPPKTTHQPGSSTLFQDKILGSTLKNQLESNKAKTATAVNTAKTTTSVNTSKTTTSVNAAKTATTGSDKRTLTTNGTPSQPGRVPSSTPTLIKAKIPIRTLSGSLNGGSETGDLYRFKYLLDYNGHQETGARNGNKEGNFYAIGDDNVERTIEYVANEFGFQPRIRWRKLDDAASAARPKENTLKDYEFVWFNKNE